MDTHWNLSENTDISSQRGDSGVYKPRKRSIIDWTLYFVMSPAVNIKLVKETYIAFVLVGEV
jgi:hypothetical protein